MIKTARIAFQQPMWAKRLVAARTMTGLTQAAIARAIGISQPRYANYEAGTREPDYATLVEICRTLRVTTDFLLVGPAKHIENKSENSHG